MFNLSARKELEDGTIDAVMVKLKISLHAMQSLDEAAVFCRNEIGRMKRFFDQVPQEEMFPFRGLDLDSFGPVPAVRDHPDGYPGNSYS